MRVLVLGSGVIGTASAYYLARQGFEVVVVDRQNGPALETSFANAGQVSPGYASPWAAPGIPLKAMKWLLMRHAPLIVRLGHVAPLTGPQAHLGKDNENGARLAIDDLNAENFKIGSVVARFELARQRLARGQA
mgnify:CR=1 FL=1